MIPEVEVPINSPTPQEFFFRGEVDREKNCVSIFLEDGNDYIRVGFKSPISEFENSISIFDNYFQEWIVWGDYLVLTDLVNSELITVKPELITALGIAQTERWEEVSPHLRTHRLLPVDQENLRFRFYCY